MFTIHRRLVVMSICLANLKENRIINNPKTIQRREVWEFWCVPEGITGHHHHHHHSRFGIPLPERGVTPGSCFTLLIWHTILILISVWHLKALVQWRELGFSWFSWCYPCLCCAQPKRPGAGPVTRTASDERLTASTRPWAVFSGRTTSEGYTRWVLYAKQKVSPSLACTG